MNKEKIQKRIENLNQDINNCINQINAYRNKIMQLDTMVKSMKGGIVELNKILKEIEDGKQNIQKTKQAKKR